MAEKQITIPGTDPKMDIVQKAGMAYILAMREASLLTDRAKKRKEEMIALASKRGVTTIKFTDDEAWTHTFEIDAHIKLKHSAFQAVRVEKVGAGS